MSLGDESSFGADSRDNPDGEYEDVIEQLDPDNIPDRFFGMPGNCDELDDILREAILMDDFETALEEVFPNQSAEYIIRTEGRKVEEENDAEYEHSQGIISMIKVGDIIVDKFTSSKVEGRAGHIQTVDQIREILNRSGIKDPQFLIKIAKAFYHLGQFDSSYYVVSERLTRNILELDDSEIDILDKADAVNMLGSLMGKYNRHAEQYKIDRSALAIVQNAFGSRNIGDEVLSRHSNIEDREDSADPINAVWLELKLKHGIAYAQSQDENIPFEEIIGQYEECLKSRRDINNDELIGRTQLDIARVYLDNGQYSEALETASEAFEELQKQQYHRHIPDALEIIQEVIKKMNEDQETISNLQRLREQKQNQIEPNKEDMQSMEGEKTEDDILNPTRSLIKLTANVTEGEELFLVRERNEDEYELPKHNPEERGIRSLLDELQKEFEVSLSRSKNKIFSQGSKEREAGNDLNFYKIELQDIEGSNVDKIGELGYVQMKFEDISENMEKFDSESQILIQKESDWRSDQK